MKPRHFTSTAKLAGFWLVTAFEIQAQNLVVNPGFESGNVDFATDYTLWSGVSIIGQNQLSVASNPQSVVSAWSSSGDHTSGSGKMLIVDGSTTTGRPFWRQTVSVAQNTTYIFSTWALKFDPDSPPILYFTVNGTQQGTFFVLPLAPTGWQGVGITWKSASSTSAVLELRLQSNKAGPGNNIGIDDISFVKSSDVPLTAIAIESAVKLNWQSYPGKSYQVQWTTGLEADANWANLGLPLTGTGATITVSDPLGVNPQRFYRVLESD